MAKHLWQKGESGNPGGRVRKLPLTDELRKQLQEKAPGSQHTHAHMIAWRMIQEAEAGSVAAARLIWEYTEGKALQQTDIEIWVIAARLAAKHGGDPVDFVQRASLLSSGMAG